MIRLSYVFQVERMASAGLIGEEHSITIDFDTDDIDHAYELADRFLDDGVVVLPEGTNLKTLRILSAS
jgi:hypothetical protein